MLPRNAAENPSRRLEVTYAKVCWPGPCSESKSIFNRERKSEYFTNEGDFSLSNGNDVYVPDKVSSLSFPPTPFWPI